MKYYNRVINISLILFFLLNILTSMVGILPVSLYYRFLLIIQIVITIIAMVTLNGRIPIKRTGKNILIIIGLSQLLAYFFDTIFEEYNCFDIHRLVIFMCMYLVLFECAKYVRITVDFNYKIHYAIIILGIVACLYNILIHRDTLFPFNLSRIMFYTSTYKSFFLTRSNFCLLLTVCYTAALFFYDEKRKPIWLFISIFFAGNIFLTNARTSIITVIFITLIFMFFQRKNQVRNLIMIIAGAVFLLTLPWDSILGNMDEIMEKYYLLFRTGTGDVTNGRVDLWKALFEGLNPIGFFIGHGVGSKDTYLSLIDAATTSFHNLWLDVFYEGGVLLLIIYVYVLGTVVKKVKESKLSSRNKRLFYNYLIVLILCGMGDAIALPFMLDTSSIFSTIFFITIPICAANGTLINKEELV